MFYLLLLYVIYPVDSACIYAARKLNNIHAIAVFEGALIRVYDNKSLKGTEIRIWNVLNLDNFMQSSREHLNWVPLECITLMSVNLLQLWKKIPPEILGLIQKTHLAEKRNYAQQHRRCTSLSTFD